VCVCVCVGGWGGGWGGGVGGWVGGWGGVGVGGWADCPPNTRDMRSMRCVRCDTRSNTFGRSYRPIRVSVDASAKKADVSAKKPDVSADTADTRPIRGYVRFEASISLWEIPKSSIVAFFVILRPALACGKCQSHPFFVSGRYFRRIGSIFSILSYRIGRYAKSNIFDHAVDTFGSYRIGRYAKSNIFDNVVDTRVCSI
jgi:hypothetical protein